MEGDVLGRVARRRRQAHRGEDPLRVVRGPLQHLHAAHRAADDAEQGLDPQLLDQHGLGADHVGDGDHRKGQAEGLAGRRVGGGRAGRAHAAAEHVRADDEVALRVERQPRPDHPVPPAGLAGQRVFRGDVLVRGQGVADEDRVAAIGVESSVSLEGDIDALEPCAGVQAQRPVRPHHPPRRQGLVRAVHDQAHAGLGARSGETVNLAARSRNAGQKKGRARKRGQFIGRKRPGRAAASTTPHSCCIRCGAKPGKLNLALCGKNFSIPREESFSTRVWRVGVDQSAMLRCSTDAPLAPRRPARKAAGRRLARPRSGADRSA